MDCWHCRRTAVGVCRFCGRGVCEDHTETLPYILELLRSERTRALVVEDALYCGACRPRPDLLDLPELDEPPEAGRTGRRGGSEEPPDVGPG
ncbi:MAG TPA: DUF2180 family protein [Actinomycetota bacterium]|nr:DUF2180 family protein [Actinomycetota bacterium]